METSKTGNSQIILIFVEAFHPRVFFLPCPPFALTSLIFLVDTCGECANGHCAGPNICECNEGYRKIEGVCQSRSTASSLL